MKHLIAQDISKSLTWLPINNKFEFADIKSYRCKYCKNGLVQKNGILECSNCGAIFKLFDNQAFEGIIMYGVDKP